MTASLSTSRSAACGSTSRVAASSWSSCATSPTRRRTEAERERMLARSSLLAEASELFDQSLDEHETMASVARLCVRDLAEACVILVPGEPSAVAAAREPGRGPRAPGAARGRPGAPDGDGDAQSQRPRHRTPIVVPLVARGRVLGVLGASFDRDVDDDDRVLFEDLGRRAALALDSARLYAERDHVARTLQSSLLPRQLPAIPGAELAARYRAAGAGNEVGGDFYDCFPTGANDWALVIGTSAARARGGRAHRAGPLHATRRGAPHPPSARSARAAQRGAAARQPRLSVLHGGVRRRSPRTRTA